VRSRKHISDRKQQALFSGEDRDKGNPKRYKKVKGNEDRAGSFLAAITAD
jgi:hypothetical protein